MSPFRCNLDGNFFSDPDANATKKEAMLTKFECTIDLLQCIILWSSIIKKLRLGLCAMQHHHRHNKHQQPAHCSLANIIDVTVARNCCLTDLVNVVVIIFHVENRRIG